MNSVEEEEVVEQSEVRSEYNEGKSKRGTEWRNWAELPRDPLFIIFKKIAAAEILSSAQFVCRPWRQLSHEPALWRSVDLRYEGFRVGDMVSMAMLVIDRSKGCMEELTMDYFPTNELMHYISERFVFVICFHYCCLVVLSNFTLRICHIDCLSISISEESKGLKTSDSDRRSRNNMHALGVSCRCREFRLVYMDMLQMLLLERFQLSFHRWNQASADAEKRATRWNTTSNDGSEIGR
ncbi:hypothetical protein KSP40_PGU005597 [Platanthera guangdongensis]|uniref:F-box domain-containing protein n=1 Tax=Platanthera guangdongensis TaxID=2320717 RepID=A0ABR2MR09_9ASPA